MLRDKEIEVLLIDISLKNILLTIRKKIMMFLKYVNRDDADKKLKLTMMLTMWMMMMNLIKIFKEGGV
jgi:hypothetical protein